MQFTLRSKSVSTYIYLGIKYNVKNWVYYNRHYALPTNLDSTSRGCHLRYRGQVLHYNDVIMSATASQMTGVTTIYLIVCWGDDQRKHQSSASLAFMWGIHLWPVISPHERPVTRKVIPFDDVIMWIVVVRFYAINIQNHNYTAERRRPSH